MNTRQKELTHKVMIRIMQCKIEALHKEIGIYDYNLSSLTTLDELKEYYESLGGK